MTDLSESIFDSIEFELGSSPQTSPALNWDASFDLGWDLFTSNAKKIDYKQSAKKSPVHQEDFLLKETHHNPLVSISAEIPFQKPKLSEVQRSKNAPLSFRSLSLRPFETCYTTELAVQSMRKAFISKF